MTHNILISINALNYNKTDLSFADLEPNARFSGKTAKIC